MRSKSIHEEGGEKAFALVFGTGEEVVLVESPQHLRKKRTDEEMGLALISIED